MIILSTIAVAFFISAIYYLIQKWVNKASISGAEVVIALVAVFALLIFLSYSVVKLFT